MIHPSNYHAGNESELGFQYLKMNSRCGMVEGDVAGDDDNAADADGCEDISTNRSTAT
jgi:hypothetical protein